MLDQALASSVFAFAVLTLALLTIARRDTRGVMWRELNALIVLSAGAAGAIANGSPAPLGIGVSIALLTMLLPRRWTAIGAAFLAALLVTTVTYATYLGQAALLLGGDLVSLGLGVMLLALELGAMGLILGAAFEMIDALCSEGGPGAIPPLPPAPERWPVVCLQVPTYNEPPELVIETIRSLVALDYPGVRVQVIDNNTTDDALWRPVMGECERLRSDGHLVEFVHLPSWPGYKGGALNWGREHLAPEVDIVGVVDADYVVDPGWLRATVPHFTDPSVAFVQTPQDYRAWESSAFYRAAYVGFAYFFKIGMVSRAHRNAIIFAGTMGLIRRAALDEVGGWDERIITEDAEISLRVLARGYRAVYVPVAYGRGIMPLTYEGLRKQRFRWAFGGIQILRRHWRTLLGRRSGLTLGQRYDHLMGGLWWFNDALTLGFTLFVLATAVGAIVGRPFVVQRLTGLGLSLPVALIVLNLLRYLWALRATTGASPALSLAALRVNLSLSWVIALACIRGVTQERGVFLRTPKFAGTPAIREIRLVWVETGIGAIAATLMIVAIARAGFSPVGIVLVALLGWAALIYGSATTFALGDPARAPFGAGLRAKMALEIAPRMNRVARSRPARAGVAGALLGVIVFVAVIASESGRPAIASLPFNETPKGPVAGDFPAVGPLPAASIEPPSPTSAGTSPGPSSTVSSSSFGVTSTAGPTSTIAPSPAPIPSPPPVPAPTPTPRPTAPVPVPTPTRPVPVPTRTQPPIPSVSSPPHPTPPVP